MPETYGLPEPEPTPAERVERGVNEALAGQSVQRTILLYVLAGLLALSPFPVLTVVVLFLLMATDPRLA